MNLIWFLIIGGLAGWLAGLIMKGRGFGVLANIGIGIVGSFIGGFLFSLRNLSAQGAVGRMVTATVGAVLLLAIVNKLKMGSQDHIRHCCVCGGYRPVVAGAVGSGGEVPAEVPHGSGRKRRPGVRICSARSCQPGGVRPGRLDHARHCRTEWRFLSFDLLDRDGSGGGAYSACLWHDQWQRWPP